jgi:uncharacterized protein YbjT (DUF2867 family)
MDLNRSSTKPILVTGATGYIGGQLIPLLLRRGYLVRCLVRGSTNLYGRSWSQHVERVTGDLIDRNSIDQALKGISTAYYLVHSMASGSGYNLRDIQAASNFASAASSNGLEQIIYLGGLANPAQNIGRHMRSRLMTGETLRQGSVPVTEFRASVIIGPGSTSFEMIRFLTEQLPVLIMPRPLNNRVQPIAIQNVLEYLLAAMETPPCRGQSFEIGGTDILTFAGLIRTYARIRGLKRKVLIVPWLPLWLMAYVVDLLTPVSRRIASPLIDGMRSDSVVRTKLEDQIFESISLLGYEAAVIAALSQK